MTVRTKKYILKAAKDSVNQKFSDQVEKLHEQIDELNTTEGHLDEDGYCSLHGGEGDAVCSICEQVSEMNSKISAVEAEWGEWTQRAKKNKKKVGKRVEWTNTRDQAPARTVNKDALKELRESRREKAKPQVGVAWLHEGALVTKRGKTDMMIVTQIAGNSVEVLMGGSTTWFRNVALRPADWMMED